MIFLNDLMKLIYSNSFIYMITMIIFTCLLIFFIVTMFSIISNIDILVREKVIMVESKNMDNNLKGKVPNLSMPERIELTNSILDLIAFMINDEIYNFMKSIVILGVPYELRNFDTDLQEISKTVFQGINPDLFTDPNLILTQEYLIAYITKKTTNTLLQTVLEHNASLRSSIVNRQDES